MSPNDQFNELNQLLATRFSEKQMEEVKRVWEFAILAHTGQKRFSGDPYITHPLAVATILAEWNLDSESIFAGLLHDTVEDGGATKQDLEHEFGEQVALLVDGVTHVATLRLHEKREEKFMENLRKMVLFMAQDIRVIIVKLADRLHNMRTLQYVPKEKQKRIAVETLEIYAPLAGRLGMGKVKGELEDLAFEFAYPDEFTDLKMKSATYYKTAQSHIQKMKRNIMRSLAEEKIEASVSGRQKHLYSLWRKLQRPEINNDFSEIHDIVALRIFVDSEQQCYGALGVVHSLFKPVPNLGISDFIAQPKPNGYQSIHTKVFGPAGRIVEVQIRTYAMHEQAENGVAAHWAYSEMKSKKGVGDKELEGKSVKASGNRLQWVKQLVEWQYEIHDTKEFYKAVKFDAFNHRNFVFSPKGDVFDLPAGATPVDFAYAVHTNLGNYIASAKVDGKIVPLDYKLPSGCVVEILKAKNPHSPNARWLDFVVTTAAKREINKRLRSQK
jgi:GTP diphosphokinase / guanosine-3',5'-bis(diphosphate) 3'-diphosphatase